MKLLCVLAFVAFPVNAQTLRTRLEGRVPATAIPAIDSLVQAARAESLPTEPLVQKAIEGGAKHVSAERIAAAVRLNLDEMRRARVVLVEGGDTPPATASEVVTVNAALKRGLSVGAVERIVAALPAESRSSAFHAVADLAAHRFNEDSATDLILAAVHSGIHGVRLLDVSASAIQELQRGHSRAEALSAVERALPDIPAPPPPARSAVARARRVPAGSPAKP